MFWKHVNVNILSNISYTSLNETLPSYYEESVVDKFKSNLLLMIFWLNIIKYNS